MSISRREFMIGASAGVMALATPAIAKPTPLQIVLENTRKWVFPNYQMQRPAFILDNAFCEDVIRTIFKHVEIPGAMRGPVDLVNGEAQCAAATRFAARYNLSPELVTTDRDFLVSVIGQELALELVMFRERKSEAFYEGRPVQIFPYYVMEYIPVCDPYTSEPTYCFKWRGALIPA